MQETQWWKNHILHIEEIFKKTKLLCCCKCSTGQPNQPKKIHTNVPEVHWCPAWSLAGSPCYWFEKLTWGEKKQKNRGKLQSTGWISCLYQSRQRNSNCLGKHCTFVYDHNKMYWCSYSNTWFYEVIVLNTVKLAKLTFVLLNIMLNSSVSDFALHLSPSPSYKILPS